MAFNGNHGFESPKKHTQTKPHHPARDTSTCSGIVDACICLCMFLLTLKAVGPIECHYIADRLQQFELKFFVCVLLKKQSYILEADKHNIFIFGWAIPLIRTSFEVKKCTQIKKIRHEAKLFPVCKGRDWHFKSIEAAYLLIEHGERWTFSPTGNESKLADGAPDGASLLWTGHFSRRESMLCHRMARVREYDSGRHDVTPKH